MEAWEAGKGDRETSEEKSESLGNRGTLETLENLESRGSRGIPGNRRPGDNCTHMLNLPYIIFRFLHKFVLGAACSTLGCVSRPLPAEAAPVMLSYARKRRGVSAKFQRQKQIERSKRQEQRIPLLAPCFFLIGLPHRAARVVMLQDLLVAAALPGHKIRAVLAHAHAVAVAQAGDAELPALVCDREIRTA